MIPATSSAPEETSPMTNTTLSESDSKSSENNLKRIASGEVGTLPRRVKSSKNDKTAEDAETEDKTKTEENDKKGKGTETEEDTKKSENSIKESDEIKYLFASHWDACIRVNRRNLQTRRMAERSNTRQFGPLTQSLREAFIRGPGRPGPPRLHPNHPR
ncbi:hypothetical protein NW768_011487 [Fusarium equiseti]|uniref:Uncharacterized protein n=1 Tax=Fusarium equiseti TaxID=61235 RepID=A0ABQ8QWQ0_FUSEQ|nr:hypothetical protein NW768_011487 [Fusarium equiseti]